MMLIPDLRQTCFLAAAFSFTALAIALVAEHAFGLAPCPLCLYQRAPFAIAVVIGFAGAMAGRLQKAAAAILALLFLANAGLAFYHSGVERQWWASWLEGCAVPMPSGQSPDELLASIQNTPPARCDQIPWADPVLGLSMANYNVALNLFLFLQVSCALLARGRKNAAKPLT